MNFVCVYEFLLNLYLSIPSLGLLKDILNTEWSESISRTLEELVVELNPVKSQCMQSGFHQVHQQKDSESNCEEYIVSNEHSDVVA